MSLAFGHLSLGAHLGRLSRAGVLAALALASGLYASDLHSDWIPSSLSELQDIIEADWPGSSPLHQEARRRASLQALFLGRVLQVLGRLNPAQSVTMAQLAEFVTARDPAERCEIPSLIQRAPSLPSDLGPWWGPEQIRSHLEILSHLLHRFRSEREHLAFYAANPAAHQALLTRHKQEGRRLLHRFRGIYTAPRLQTVGHHACSPDIKSVSPSAGSLARLQAIERYLAKSRQTSWISESTASEESPEDLKDLPTPAEWEIEWSRIDLISDAGILWMNFIEQQLEQLLLAEQDLTLPTATTCQAIQRRHQADPR